MGEAAPRSPALGAHSPTRIPSETPSFVDRLAAVHPLHIYPFVAGTTAIGGVRPSTELGGGKRAGGRYVLGDLLGRGGMAEVFAGHSIGDHGFQKPVAIKRLLPELAQDHVFVERLITEAKLLVGMQHGNIVSVLDLARDGDDVFLVMEFVDGPSLRQLLKARGSRGISLGTATYVVQAAATGLEFAHSRPGGAIVHADISPSNLLLTTSGEVRVADFGIARREGGGYGIVEGKWAYMAPEQARGEPLSARSDVFALGVVLYELITGAHPFGRQVTHEERDSEPMRVIPPRVVKPSIPHGLDAICMRALAHDPRDRYKSMQHMIDAIVEERFANQYREGASDLAQAIRECAIGSPVLAQPRTQITDRPVTIVTRSLIELTPPRRASRGSSSNISQSRSQSQSEYSQSEASMSRSARGTPPPMSDELLRAAALLEIPPMLRADGTPMPPFRLSPQPMQGTELDSVVGGNTVTGAVPGVAASPVSSTRWTIAILGLAALIGAIAAAVIQLTPSDSNSNEAAPPPVSQPAVVQEPTPQPATEPAIVAEPKKEEAPAPSKEADPPPTIETVNVPTGSEEVKEEVKEEIKDEPSEPKGGAVRLRPSSTGKRQTTKRQVAEAASKEPPGVLRVGSPVFAWVTVGDQTKEFTERFYLAPGKYTVKVQNHLTKETKKYPVEIKSEKVTSILVEWEDE